MPDTAQGWPLKGVGIINGDGWKDTTTVGEVVFVYGRPLPAPYVGFDGRLQFERIGNVGWTASADQYAFQPASLLEVLRLIPTIWRDRKDRSLYAFRREF